MDLEPVRPFISRIGCGDFDHALFIDQAGVDAVLVLISLKQLLQIFHPDAHSHHAGHSAVGCGDLAVYKHRDFILRTRHLVVIHIQGIFQITVQQFIVPDVFRIPSLQDPIQSVKIVVAPGRGGDQKHGIKPVFLLIVLQISFCGLYIRLVLQMLRLA